MEEESSFVAPKFFKHDMNFRCVSSVRCVEEEPIFAIDNFSDCIWKQKREQGERMTIPGYRNRHSFSPKREIAFQK